MRIPIFSVFLCFLFTTTALTVKTNQKPILVTYPADTPQSVVDEAMATLKKAGGVITHEYSLIKGFAAKASVDVVETLKTMGSQYVPIIENDMLVGINDA